MNNWMTRAYSRLLIDNHITEDDPSFMRRFDPEQYVAMVKRAGVEAAMVYATCHNGNCYYPSRVGHMHANLDGRDIFGEVVAGLRREGIIPVAYYTTIYHNQSARENPAWRITDRQGKQHGGRYWWSCPNCAEYVDFTLAQIAEVIDYEIEGIFVDMTFWPVICACHNCRAMYRAETGLEIPAAIDWANPEWVRFQRFRERSMGQFTAAITDAIRARKDITVTHQTSTIMHGWAMGYTLAIADACDYTSGDFYAGKYQQILGAKVLAGASNRLPFEFMTTRCVNLRDHTSMKSTAQWLCEGATTLASGGAYFLIDAINPDGTLEPAVYARLGTVSAALAPYAETVKQHQPVIHADTAFYFSPESFVDARGAEIMTGSGKIPAVDELTGASILLTRAHRPFKVVTPRHTDYDGLRTILMPNVRYTSDEENDRLRRFVAEGGTLVATGLSTLFEMNGVRRSDFGLGDVFGVSIAEGWTPGFHYLSCRPSRDLVSSHAAGPRVTASAAEVLAVINEPRFEPGAERYASIHSNPPGRDTEYVGLTVNAYGKGRCVYLASPIFSLQQDAQQTFLGDLLAERAPSEVVLDTNAPASVEISLLQSTTAPGTWLLCAVNYQLELPNVPVVDLDIAVRLPGVTGDIDATCVSDGGTVDVTVDGGDVSLTIPRLDTIEMVVLTTGG